MFRVFYFDGGTPASTGERESALIIFYFYSRLNCPLGEFVDVELGALVPKLFSLQAISTSEPTVTRC